MVPGTGDSCVFLRLLPAAALLVLPVAAARAADPPLELTIKDHAFAPAELRVKAGQPVVLHIRNEDATAEEFDSASLKVEKVIPAHGEATVRIRPLKPGTYKFEGEYHEDTAQGTLVAE